MHAQSLYLVHYKQTSGGLRHPHWNAPSWGLIDTRVESYILYKQLMSATRDIITVLQ